MACERPSGPWLLIVDNIVDTRLVQRAWDSDQMSQHDFDLLRCLPQRAGSAVLITSHDRQVAFALTNHEDRTLRVEVMDSKEAAGSFDKKLASPRGDRADKDRLATALE